MRHAARVARVRFLRIRFRNGAGQGHGRNRAERINESRVRVRHRQHVGGFNALPSADARTVKTVSFSEDFLGQLPNRTTKMLPSAKGVHELDVHHLGPALLG